MRKVAILSDIHGNLPALKAVLREVAKSGASEIVFGGDIVGYGASPKECVELVRGLGGRCVMGNHDAFTREILELGRGWDVRSPVWAGVAYAVRELDAGELEWLWGLPWSLQIPGAVVAHAELSDPGGWNYLFDDVAAGPTLEILGESGIGVGFFGHTHRQRYFFDEEAEEFPEELEDGRILLPEGSVCAVTVGSVGQPREWDDRRAGWAIWDAVERTVEFRRTEYPALEAAIAIIEAGLPEESAMRLLGDDEMDALFWGGHLQ